MSPATAAWLVLAAPLAGFLLLTAAHRPLRDRPVVAGVVGTGAVAVAFVLAVLAAIGLGGEPEEGRQIASSLWTYAEVAGISVRMELLVDPLSTLMMLVVSGVSALIHLYSVAYMRSDGGYVRFFAYLNLFVFSMLLLVLAANLVLLTVGWALVGAASYLLVSFWFRRETATRAGVKAFVVNVVGDVGLVLGTILLLRSLGTVDLLELFARAPQVYGDDGGGSLTAALLLLMVGAFAKSAQLPLHTWLPDAMEGPTPVSSLIHAATMVTAGVYLIARLHPLMDLSPTAQAVGALVGLATLLVAGTIGLVQDDLKRVIAYSTMSQIGYMIMAVSAGAYVAGLFHLMTHAFFKALLFMAAGSVIAAMAGMQSLDRMGGFRRAMPFTYAAFVIGGLALAGVPPFSGFFSKDEILAYVAAPGGWHWVLYAGGLLGAVLTAVYTGRIVFRTFWGDPCPEAAELERGHLHHATQHTNPATGEVEDTSVGFPGPEHHIAERAGGMKVAMGTLAVLAVVGGLIQVPGVVHLLEDFLEPTFAGIEEPSPSTTLVVVGLLLGTVASLGGLAIAYVVWVARPGTSARLQARFAAPHRLFLRKWYFDEIIHGLVVVPFRALGRFARDTFEKLVVGGALIGGATGAARGSGALVRRLQSGFLRAYGAAVIGGGALLLLYVLVAG